MASFKNPNNDVITITENILITIDDTDHGDMYVYDDKYRYILNGMTASELIEYFNHKKGDTHLSEEIQDTMMSLTVNEETH